jgi:phosphoheptose isomerase
MSPDDIRRIASTVNAVSNDMGFAAVFRRQVEAHGRPGDLALGISTSGRSPNLVEALRAARQRGLVAVVEDQAPR